MYTMHEIGQNQCEKGLILNHGLILHILQSCTLDLASHSVVSVALNNGEAGNQVEWLLCLYEIVIITDLERPCILRVKHLCYC